MADIYCLRGNWRNIWLHTLFNIYAPPESEKSFYKTVFDIITQETEGILICGGNWNVVLNNTLDSSSTKKNSKTHLTRYINTNLAELGVIDVWRECHPLERDYTFYSAPHSVYTRIDYFFMNVEDRFRIMECGIGTADLSDHCILYLLLDLSRRLKNTTWRLNVGMLNDSKLVDNLKKEINTYKNENDKEGTDPTMLWDAMKAVMRGKLISYASFIKKKILLDFQTASKELENLEHQHKINKNPETLKKIKLVRRRIDEILTKVVEKKM